MKRYLPAIPLVVLGWLLGAAQPVQAQNPAMSLMGSVQSDSQAPLPGAAITVIHLPSGVRHAAATDAAGRFMVANLMVGGPYLIRVGEGGYRPQTVENIFLETGKTTNFTVTLNKLSDAPGKASSRNNAPSTPTLALADEAAIGGPVLVTTLSGAPRPAPAAASTRPTASHATSKAAPVPAPAASPPMPAASAPAPAPAPAPTTPAAAAAPATERYPRYSRYPARRPTDRVADPIVPGHFDAKTGNYLYDTGQPTTLKLPGGGTVPNVGANSTESNLFRFLSDPQMQVDSVDLTRGWYNFDRVYFEAGKATLTPESVSQLRNIATLLRAYPKTRLKLGGYTDDTGTYKVNKELSEARARTAWASLVEMGISPSRLDARGYGPNYSISSNATEEGRAQNRRLSVKVLQK
ncbi:OmpA family protein [Hymenobacter artigasi]|uniref:Outer membrane protein OmpA-like peptidoglycan-associated protein n=1 Tax=Hymenobacter artigasi TaxID=2719616 RepID=A0ABX1HDS3_9BACT|nr:OmpA family protein [Hymenobacter artigasi]NKI88030.1 outer membrane protein OmpA-like peptidoglycan-associated protein [Hymenobacter artigasi]